jgi:hypothetical protein
LDFIRAKYFGREMGVPELDWYVDVETPLDPATEYVFARDDDTWDGEYSEETEVVTIIGNVMLKDVAPLKAAAKKKGARRVSVSSSESDVSISEVLKEVVKDYAATHSRTTRAGGGTAEKAVAASGDLICFD